MTLETLTEAIKRLILKRLELHGNSKEQERVNAKLTKLYELKWIMLNQQIAWIKF